MSPSLPLDTLLSLNIKLCPPAGKLVSHTEEFLNLRAQRISHAHREQDRLLLRLEKLMRVADDPSDSPAAGLTRFTAGSAALKRKAAQKALVPWAADKDVPLCPICAAEFNRITRRKHHCRLCGFVMCGDCSNFLSETAASRFFGQNFQSALGS